MASSSTSSSPQLAELLVALLKSPRGLVAVLAAVGSLVAFVYLFILKSGGSSSKRGQSKSRSKQSSPASKRSQQQTALTSKKASPTSSKKASNSAEKKDSPGKQSSNGKSKSPTGGKSDSKRAPAKSANEQSSTEGTKKTGQLAQKQTLGKPSAGTKSTPASSKALKDEGEWITVTKKKSKVTSFSSAKKAEPESRSSGQRSSATSNTSRPARR